MAPAPGEASVLVNCIGGTDGVDVAYSEQRLFLESQGWWGQRNTSGGVPNFGNSEHIHVGMCFPLKQTVSNNKTFVVRVRGHKLKIGSEITSTSLHDPDSGQGNGIGLATITWNYTIQAGDNGSFDKWDTVTVNTKLLPNGMREFRNLTKVERPDNDEIHASSGWCWNVSNTNPIGTYDSGTCANTPNATSGRGWYSCFEYKIAEVKNWAGPATPAVSYPWAGINRGNSFTFRVAARDGAGKLGHTDFDRWEVRLNPDFHAQINGTLIASGNAATNGTSVTINDSLLTGPDTHRVVILGLSDDTCSVTANGRMAAVLSFPLKVN
jgi:hypothetical protein